MEEIGGLEKAVGHWRPDLVNKSAENNALDSNIHRAYPQFFERSQYSQQPLWRAQKTLPSLERSKQNPIDPHSTLAAQLLRSR